MAELNFKQITDKLNQEFNCETRKLIFWYDAEGEFAQDVDDMELVNAKVYHLQKDNQFYTKYFLERVDTATNYLVYAPFPKPDISENHLEDTIRYSHEFFADRASLIVMDLNMDARCKPIIQHYIKFFANKQRTQAFYDLEMDTYNRPSIEVGLMSVLCKCKHAAFEEVLRCVLADVCLEENPLLEEFEKYDLLAPFWQQCGVVLGYVDEQPTLTKLAMTMFVTYAGSVIQGNLPASWRPFLSFKAGNIIAFLDNLMNSVLYQACFDALSNKMEILLNIGTEFISMPQNALLDCCLFRFVDISLMAWMKDRLVNEDADAKLSGKTIPEICAARRKMHFGPQYHDEYFVIENAWYLVQPKRYVPLKTISQYVQHYTAEWFQIDRRYRYFYYYLDRIEEKDAFEALRGLVERIYTNDYLNPLLADYSAVLTEAQGNAGIPTQHSFYRNVIQNAKDRVAVIISDGMRYEVGVTLFERLQADEKCTASISVMQSMLPSVTRLGMAALLPHQHLSVLDADTVLVDNMPANDIKQREAILQRKNPNSRAVQFDAIKGMSQEELRAIFAHQDIVYIYHDQIDARGDKAKTENEVFVACEEAIEEITRLIRRLTTCANTSHFIVTSDHGFIYKRDQLDGSSKISGYAGASDRYLISDEPIRESGVCALPLKAVCGVDDGRVVNVPMGSDLFRAPGSGKNYVHGGCSPLEMLVPVIDVKTEKAKKETTSAVIDLISLLNKITNLITTLDFIQTEPISDVVKETVYRVYFISDEGKRISNENMFTADKKEQDASKRIFRLRFSFKNQKYDRSHKYYLVAVDDKTGREVLRREVLMDLAFSDDFGFGF